MSADKTLLGKHIWTEVMASDHRIGNGLNDRPPLRVKQDALAQPVTNEVLARLPFVARVPPNDAQSVSNRSLLSAGNLNGPPQRGNVCALHGYRNNTNRFVFSTNPVVRQQDTGVCTVA